MAHNQVHVWIIDVKLILYTTYTGAVSLMKKCSASYEETTTFPYAFKLSHLQLLPNINIWFWYLKCHMEIGIE